MFTLNNKLGNVKYSLQKHAEKNLNWLKSVLYIISTLNIKANHSSAILAHLIKVM